MNAVSIILIVLFLLFLYIGMYRERNNILDRAKRHGILIQGAHYKVYKIYRSSSYTDGGVYIEHHDAMYFGEVMLVSPEGQKLYISESHLKHCLKVRNHKGCKKDVDGKMTSRWSEWRIDPDGDDQKGLKENDVYLWLY